MLKSVQILKQRSIERKTRLKDDIAISGKLRHELTTKLEKLLQDNTSVKFEVRESKLGVFMDLLDEKLLADYEYVQVEDNIFIFKRRVISI